MSEESHRVIAKWINEQTRHTPIAEILLLLADSTEKDATIKELAEALDEAADNMEAVEIYSCFLVDKYKALANEHLKDKL